MSGDRISPAEGAHVAGMVLLLAFSAAFILSSARAAKPAEVPALPVIVRALMPEDGSAGVQWRDIEARLGIRWNEASPGTRPPGLETSPALRHAKLTSRTGGAQNRLRARNQDAWQLTGWGSDLLPRAVRVRREGSGGFDVPKALEAANIRFMLECETESVRYYRLALAGRRAGYAVEYRLAPDRVELLYFWQAPPDALLSRDGCLLTHVMR